MRASGQDAEPGASLNMTSVEDLWALDYRVQDYGV